MASEFCNSCRAARKVMPLLHAKLKAAVVRPSAGLVNRPGCVLPFSSLRPSAIASDVPTAIFVRSHLFLSR